MTNHARRNACDGKHAYGSWWRALRDARRINRKHDENVWPYRCHWCSAVHLGHVDPAYKGGRPRETGT